METHHEQVPFLTFYGKAVTVDAGLFDILTVLKRLGVRTQYSCEDGGTGKYGGAYILASGRSAWRFERLVKKLYSKGKLTSDASQIVENFLRGNRETEVSHFVKRDRAYREYRFLHRVKRKPRVRYIIERSYSPEFGFRITYRWPPTDSVRLLAALNEIARLTSN